MMVLTPIPWIGRVWALPCLTVLAPSERYPAGPRGRPGVRHKKLTAPKGHPARQMIRQVRRWVPDRTLVVVELLATGLGLRQPVTVVTRLRLDARAV